MPGRRPKPTALKLLEGNPGKRALNHAEPQPDKVAPEMPKGMPKGAQREWRRIAPKLLKLGLLSEIDGRALEEYCRACALCEEAQKMLKVDGSYLRKPIVVKDIVVGENIERHPAFVTLEKWAPIKKAYLIEFGLTPASRAKLKVEKPPVEDPLDALLNHRPQIVAFPVAEKQAGEPS